jgi:antitoxin (DNA-binding transcriptional repressor) of toxin-antitoxin stability system
MICAGRKPMKKLTIRQTRQALGNLDRLLAEEGEVTITRRGGAIARVLPVGAVRTMPSHAALRRSMPRMRKGSERLVREDRDAR